MNVRTVAALVTVALSALLVGCSPGGLGEATAPKAHSAKEALGDAEECRKVAAYAEPLIVDWKGQQRLDLELAMKEGGAVVAFTCDSFKVLKGCSFTGSYSFAGVSRKEDVVQLTNRDEVKANLPLSGASLGADLEQGTTIDLALVMIGKKATTVRTVARQSLEGSCEGATHFVRGATIGAFAMDRGALGAMRAAVEVFGAGVSGASSSKRREQNKDGELEDCSKSRSDDGAPPDQCQAALRLELVPLVALPLPEDESGGKKDKQPAATAQLNPCPEGMVLSDNGNKCSKPIDAESHLCKDKDLQDCAAQCSEGDAGSCYNLGLLLTGDVANRDEPRAEKVFKTACEKGFARACGKLGKLLCRRKGDCRDVDQAITQLKRGCDLGDGSSCFLLFFGGGFELGVHQAVKYGERACSLGSSGSCSLVSMLFLGAVDEFEKDVPKAIAVLQRSCEGEAADSCMILAGVLTNGQHMPPDPKRALGVWKLLCQRKSVIACGHVAETYFTGATGVPKDRQRAVQYWRRGCTKAGAFDVKSCANLGQHLWDDDPGEALRCLARACEQGKRCAQAARLAAKQVMTKLRSQCDAGDGVACDELSQRLLARGCRDGDKYTCSIFGQEHPAQAYTAFFHRCARAGFDAENDWCKRYVTLGGVLTPPKKKRAR